MKASGLVGAVARAGGRAGPTDGELLGRYARTRDEDAFRALVARHGQRVWGAAVRRAGDRHADEDAVQAAFLALARQADRLAGDACVAGWLHAVAVRAAARSRRRRPVELAADPPAPSADPLDALSAREVLAVIDTELARLPDRYRLPLLLCGLDGLSRDEAAARLGWPVGSLKGRLERGRELLRKRLARRGLAAGTGLLVVGTPLPAGLAAGVLAAVRGPTPAVAALAGAAVGASRWPLLLAAAMATVGLGLAVGPGLATKPTPVAVPQEKPAADVVTVTVLSDGKPAAGAKVWAFYRGDDLPAEDVPPAPTPTDAAGTARMPLPPAPKETWRGLCAFATDTAGQLGAVAFDERTGRAATIRLQPAADLAVRLLEPDGTPVSGATLTTRGFRVWAADRGPDTYYREDQFPLPRWLAVRKPASTDSAGRFRIPGVPAGHIVYLALETTGHGSGVIQARQGAADVLTLPKAGRLTLALAGALSPEQGKGLTVRVTMAGPRKLDGLWANPTRTLTLAGTPAQTETNLPAGEYELTPDAGGTAVYASPAT